MKTINYKAVRQHWNNSFTGEFKYGEGYKIDDENFALLRFKTEISSLKKILRRNKAEKRSFLDVGCGNGKYSFYFSHSFNKVVGVDFSAASLRIAKHEAVRRGLTNCVFYCSDLKKLNLKEKFDVIFVGGVLMYIKDEDLAQALQKLSQHLNEDGVIVLREPLFTKNQSLVRSGEYHVIYRSLQSMKEALRKESLQVTGEELNPGYMYGIIVDFYMKLLPRILNKKTAQKITFNHLAKPWFLKPNYLLLKNKVQSKGYFLTVRKK